MKSALSATGVSCAVRIAGACMSQNRRLFARRVSQWRRLRRLVASFRMTIRGRILIAFLVMSMITAALGGYATWGIKDAGVLVRKTYDQSLMSINYARAAATDFAAMRAAFARRWIATDPAMRATLDEQIENLAKTLTGRSDDRGAALAVGARQAGGRQCAARGDAWKDLSGALARQDQARRQLGPARPLRQEGRRADRSAGQLYRRRRLPLSADGARDGRARRAVQHCRHGSCGAPVGTGGLGAGAAHRSPGRGRIECRRSIATGKLDVVIPKGSADELGALLASMGLMRDNIKMMMEREVAQRRSAQTRLADALESSQEGVVVVDADDRIALANAQAADFLGVPPELMKPGTPLADLRPR